ncbi:MAG: putative quinol monooxygenase [Desulfosudaceae bacterium]
MVVIARLKVQQEKQAEAEKILTDFVATAKEEPDPLAYNRHRHQHDPTVFLFYEKYKDAEALMVHSATDHFKKTFENPEPGQA